ncbi:MAG: hypothetical protein GY757_42060 [bacterium]|nr:hypothetical protein [bacterium]
MKRAINFFVFLTISFGLLCNFSCKKAEVIDDTVTVLSMKRAIGYTAATVAGIGFVVYTTSTLVLATLQQQTTEAASGASYNSGTGWWNLSVDLANQQSADINVRFLDASGAFHQYYGSSTSVIESNGSGSGTDSSFTYDFTLTNAGTTETTLIINGAGSISYNGEAVIFTLTDMTMDKLEDGIPDSGSLNIHMDEALVTVTFTGSETIEVTLTFHSHSYTFNVNLNTGEVT